MHAVPQISGHTIHAVHIEPAETPFFVEFSSPAYTNVLQFAAGRRWMKVLARTAEGAIKVAQYHYSSGRDFTLLPNHPEE